MKNQYAFSLIELIIAVAILGILMAMVLPDIQYAINNNRITTRANEFVSAFHLARSTAVTYGREVHIESLEDSDWSSGWKIWRDDNNNKVEAEDGSEVIKVFEYPKKPSKNILIAATDVKPIIYKTSGKTEESQGVIFTVCVENRQSYEPTGRRIRIGNTGQVSIVDKNFSCLTAS